jgi:menaquinone-specific isochorismate synthase
VRRLSREVAAYLRDPRGEVIDPASLEVAAIDLDEDELGALAAAARRHGRVLERDGLRILGLGTAAQLELPKGLKSPGAAAAIAGLLASMTPSTDRTPAVALGALPFDPFAPGHLSVPACVVRVPTLRRGEMSPRAGLAVLVGGRGETARIAEVVRANPDALSCGPSGHAQAPGGPPAHELGPERFELSSPSSHDAFCRLVADAVAAIRQGRLDKVVLAREVDVVTDRPLRQDDLLARLRLLHPSCMAFAIDGFVGASPELLCRRTGTRVTSVPLAGTVARSGDVDEDRRLAASLLASEKDRAEHALVVRAILESLKSHCRVVESAKAPTVLELRNVAHLATDVVGDLAPSGEGGVGASALELAAALHPTPAVGGWPLEEALAYLAENEGLERDRYAGPVGYLDADGDGEFWIGIRSALVEGTRARLLAGVGIVADSDPLAELAETQLKLQALLAVAVRP